MFFSYVLGELFDMRGSKNHYRVREATDIVVLLAFAT